VIFWIKDKRYRFPRLSKDLVTYSVTKQNKKTNLEYELLFYALL